jgi:trigger factor
MKKENRKAAQERRAQERAKAQKKAAIMNVLKWVLPTAIVAILVIAIIIAIVGGGSSSSDDETEAETTVQTVEDGSATEEDGSSATEEDGDVVETEEAVDESETSLDTTDGLVVANGDTVNIDYTGYLDGEAFSGGSTNGAGADLTIGSETYIEGFEEGLIGHSVGETFDLNLTFPDDYYASDLAGKDVVFTTTINGIYK